MPVRRVAPVLAVALALAACGGGGKTEGGGVDDPGPGADGGWGGGVLASCGDPLDVLRGSARGPVRMDGRFPTLVQAGATFSGTVWVSATDAPATGVAAAAADVFVAQAGRVVATPVAKDALGRLVELQAGKRQEFTAEGAASPCAGAVLASGRYEIYAALAIDATTGDPILAVAGPWPLEIT